MTKPTWEEIGKDVLWQMASSFKDVYSNYAKIIADGYENKGYPKGSIGMLYHESWLHPNDYQLLTWKELYIEMGGENAKVFIPDGHDCEICPKRNKCHSFFKNDPKQERCNDWKKEYNILKPIKKIKDKLK